MLPRNCKITTDKTRATFPLVRINYVRKFLHGVGLIEFDELALQVNTIKSHLKIITEGLLEYFTTMTALSKQKREMRSAMRKLCDMSFKRFAARLTEINNFPPIFPGSNAIKKMPK